MSWRPAYQRHVVISQVSSVCRIGWQSLQDTLTSGFILSSLPYFKEQAKPVLRIPHSCSYCLWSCQRGTATEKQIRACVEADDSETFYRVWICSVSVLLFVTEQLCDTWWSRQSKPCDLKCGLSRYLKHCNYSKMQPFCLSAVPSNHRALCLSAACFTSFWQSCIIFKVGVLVICLSDNDLNCIPLAFYLMLKFVRLGDRFFLGTGPWL